MAGTGPLLGCSIHLPKRPGWYYHTHVSDGSQTHRGQIANRGHAARVGFAVPKPALAPGTVCALDHGSLRGESPENSISLAWWSLKILKPLLLLWPCWLLAWITAGKRLPYCVQLLVGSLRPADGWGELTCTLRHLNTPKSKHARFASEPFTLGCSLLGKKLKIYTRERPTGVSARSWPRSCVCRAHDGPIRGHGDRPCDCAQETRELRPRAQSSCQASRAGHCPPRTGRGGGQRRPPVHLAAVWTDATNPRRRRHRRGRGSGHGPSEMARAGAGLRRILRHVSGFLLWTLTLFTFKSHARGQRERAAVTPGERARALCRLNQTPRLCRSVS